MYLAFFYLKHNNKLPCPQNKMINLLQKPYFGSVIFLLVQPLVPLGNKDFEGFLW